MTLVEHSELDRASGARRGRAMGYINMAAFHRGFVAAAAAAIRNGIPAERIDGDIVDNGDAAGSLPAPDPRIETLKHNIDQEFLRAARAPIGSEEERSAREAGERYKRELGHLLSASTDRSNAPDVPSALTVRTERLVQALQALLHDDGRVSQEQVHAIDTVVTDLSVTPQAGNWCATASLRVPLVDGVGRLGPVQWSTPMYGRRGATLLLDRLGENGQHRKQPIADRDELEDLGLNRSAAATALNCGLPWIIDALRHRLTGSPLPPETPEQWRDPLFLSWLEAVYTNPDFQWTVAHTRYQFVGQALIDAIIDRGGSSTGRELCKAIPRMTSNRLYLHFRQPAEIFTGEEVVTPVIQRTRVSTSGVNSDGGTYELRHCRCGHTAELAVGAPEVPSRLLCRCGRMVDAERYGMDPDMRFPPEYMLLAPDREAVAEFYEKDRGRRSHPVIGPTQQRILTLAAVQNPHELTAREIGDALNVPRGQIEVALNKLEDHGWVQRRVPPRDPQRHRGRIPSLWTVVQNPIGTDEVILSRGRPRADASRTEKTQSAAP